MELNQAKNVKIQTLRSRPDIRHYTFKPCATGQVASGANPSSKMRSENMKMCVLSMFHVFRASGMSYSDVPRRVNMKAQSFSKLGGIATRIRGFEV